MLDDPPLLTIKAGFTRPDPAHVAALKGAQTSHLVDAMDGRGALDWTIKPCDPANASFVGVAVTCHAYPADNLALFGAMEIAQPGDVIMCANDSYRLTALVGDLVDLVGDTDGAPDTLARIVRITPRRSVLRRSAAYQVHTHHAHHGLSSEALWR